MKILQLSKYYPPTFGGIELVADFFSRAVKDLGHDCSVISMGNNSASYSGKYGEEVLQSKENLKFCSSPMSAKYFFNVKREIKENKPDVILIHLPNPFAHEVVKWLRIGFKRKNIKIVGIYHSDIVNQARLVRAYNYHFKKNIDLYDYFICSSENLKKSSPILSKLPDNKVKVIPFCIDHPYIGQTFNRNDNFQGKFITIGRLVPYKGYEFLIKCFNSLPYNLTIVGNGPLGKKLRKIAGPNIKFVGQISEDEKFKYLSEHDALIMSSINRAEAYGMTIVEAFSVGLPVIAANIDTGVSYLVKEKLTGLKYTVNNQDDLKRQINFLKNEPEFIKNLSHQSYKFFNKELSYIAFKKNLENFLKFNNKEGIEFVHAA